MISALKAFLKQFTDYLGAYGWWGTFIGMAIESACIPLPSELIMPLAGYLVHQGKMTLLGATMAGTLGNVVGSWIAYYAGVYGGRPLLEKYGKYVLIHPKKLEIADSWFQKYGDAAIFFSRLLPIVRTFISLPAGIARMNIVKFTIYTFLGSLPWTFLFAWLGYAIGEHWHEVISPWMSRVDVIFVVLAAIVIAVWWYFRQKKQTSSRS